MPVKPQFNNQDVEVLTTTPLYDGFFKMVQYKLKHKLFAGGWSGEVTREMFERGHAVALLPYDPNTQEFVLIEQFRLGAMATSDSPWLIEVIAGMIDDGYTPEDVCHKEAQEEAVSPFKESKLLSKSDQPREYVSSPLGAGMVLKEDVKGRFVSNAERKMDKLLESVGYEGGPINQTKSINAPTIKKAVD